MVSGNVSFYNGTNKKNIYPTPVIGGVGLIKNLTSPVGHNFKKENSKIIIIGKTFGHLGQSCFLKEVYSLNEGHPPIVNLTNEKNNGEAVLNLINRDLVLSAYDISSGGIILALSEMSMGTEFGIKIEKPKELRNLNEYFFGEDQGRYILEIDQNNLAKVEKFLDKSNIHYENIGLTQRAYFEIIGEMKLDNNALFKANNQWYNSY